MTHIPKVNPNHKRRAPKQSVRNEFKPKIRQAIYDREGGLCQSCGGLGNQVHHVKYKSQMGRGVITNGMLICNDCHDRIHKDKQLSNEWVKLYRDKYGHDFYKDEWDE